MLNPLLFQEDAPLLAPTWEIHPTPPTEKLVQQVICPHCKQVGKAIEGTKKGECITFPEADKRTQCTTCGKDFVIEIHWKMVGVIDHSYGLDALT